MDLDYIRVIDSFVETVNTPKLVIDNRSYVISSNKAAVDLLGNDFKGRHYFAE
jgi:hypothetical protein